MIQTNIDKSSLMRKLRIDESTLEKLLHLQIPITHELFSKMIKAFGAETSATIYEKHNNLVKIKRNLEKEGVENDFEERF